MGEFFVKNQQPPEQNSKRQQQLKPTDIQIILPTQAYFLSGIRDFTLNLIKNLTHFGEKWAYRFQSIVDELCNNAIEHGSRDGEKIRLDFYTEPNKLIRISVEDSGTGEKNMTAEELGKLIEDRRIDQNVSHLIRGRGLPKIVAEWTDELKFEDTEKGGIKVTVTKYLDKPEIEQYQTEKLENQTHIVLN